MKNVYLIQPYEVGSKKGKSLAVILPVDVRKQCDIYPSTILTLRVDGKTKSITLQDVMAATAGQSVEPSAQQMSSLSRESK